MSCIRLGLLGLVLAVGVGLAYDDYMMSLDMPPDSSEHGTFAGRKRTSCKCGWSNKDTGRIVGGEETQINEYPHMVALGNYIRGSVAPFCGGTIVTEHHAISAAHCTYGINIRTNPLGIVVGDHDFTTVRDTDYSVIHELSNVIDHPLYDPDSKANDITILVTRLPIQMNQRVGPACLPTGPVNMEGLWVKVTGWGHTQWKGMSSPRLNKVNLKVVNTNSCLRLYGRRVSQSPSQFCTFSRGKDSCQGDSGGPVTYLDPETNRYTLMGVVSFGYECASDAPGVNTAVGSFLDWIDRTIQSTLPRRFKTCNKID